MKKSKCFTLAESTPCFENLTCVTRHAKKVMKAPCIENLTCVARHAKKVMKAPCFENLTCVARRAFTLAEVLIVIGVIGVVAAITIPTLIPLIKEKVNSNRKEVIEDRLIQGMNQLNTLDDGFNGSQYATTGTEGFVEALSKHYKMTQICGATELRNCFPYSSLTYNKKDGTADTKNWSDLKTPEDFGLKSDEYYAPAGFISSQGTPFVMLLKKDCIMDTGEGMRAIPTSCVQYIYDNNGSSIPNKMDSDLVSSDDIAIGVTMIDGTFKNSIGAYKTYLILNHAKWADAKKACAEKGFELPTKEQLQELYCHAKGTTNQFYSCSNTTLDQTLATKIAEKAGVAPYFWSSTPYDSNYSYVVDYLGGGAYYDFIGNIYNMHSVLCLGK